MDEIAKGEGVYVVYCGDAKAQELISSNKINELERFYRVKITYKNGQFLIERNEQPVVMHQQAKHALITFVKFDFQGGSKNFQWFWFNGYLYIPYDDASNTIIEEAYAKKRFNVKLQINGRPYVLNLVRMHQISQDGTIRVIGRNPPVPPLGIYMQGNPRKPKDKRDRGRKDREGKKEEDRVKPNRAYTAWFYQFKSTWKQFPNYIAQNIESSVSEQNYSIDVRLGKNNYRLDLQNMKMTDLDTNAEVPLRKS